MTSWTPSIDGRPGPRYAAILDALEEAVRTGVLVEGDRLPPQRDLAESLDVSLGTVTRAYTEARERGLLKATVGRGTFVRSGAGSDEGGPPAQLDRELVDLSLLTAPILEEEGWRDRLEGAGSALAARSDLEDLLGYRSHRGTPRHRRAAAAWIERTGMPTSPGQVLLAGSAQHAAVAALSVLTRPGDTVLAEALTNPGLKDAASWLHLRLHGLPCDEEGLRPEAFEAACRSGLARVLYTMPTYHNPTTRTMSEPRREEIAALAAEHGVSVVEDGVHALLSDEAPSPLVDRLPDLGYFVNSHSKTMSPSLRVGYLRAPAGAHEELDRALRATLWMVSPLLAEVVSAWIEDGTADGILEAKRSEARARQILAGEILPDGSFEAGPTSHHLWLRLPERWRAEAFEREARRRGVALSLPSAFVAGQVTTPRAVRVSLGAARSRDRLREGLEVLRKLFESDRPSGARR